MNKYCSEIHRKYFASKQLIVIPQEYSQRKPKTSPKNTHNKEIQIQVMYTYFLNIVFIFLVNTRYCYITINIVSKRKQKLLFLMNYLHFSRIGSKQTARKPLSRKTNSGLKPVTKLRPKPRPYCRPPEWPGMR